MKKIFTEEVRKINRIKFRERERTDFIIVADIDLENKRADRLFKDARRRGEFDVDFHYVIHRDGHTEVGRDPKTVGGLQVDPYEVSVIIFVDTTKEGKESDAAQAALRHVLDKLKVDFKGAEVVRIKGEYIPVNYAEYACTSAFTVR